MLNFKKKPSKTELEVTSPLHSKQDAHRDLVPQSHENSPDPGQRTSSPEEVENFFSFTGSSDVNIWGDDFTAILKKNTLRKMSLISEEAVPLEAGDPSTENIGVAYLEPSTMRRTKLHESSDGPPTRRITSPPAMEAHRTTGHRKILSTSDIRPRTRTDVSSLLPTSSLPVGRLEVDPLDRVVQLEQELQDLKNSRWTPPTIPETIDRILVGKPYCLEWFKSPVEKRALLDAAIATNDGNTITAVLLFIRKSVSKPLLLGMLKKRPIAVSHYAIFLKQLGATTELSNLYMRLDLNERLADLKLQQCESEMNPRERYSKLRDCHTLFNSKEKLKHEAKQIEDYARLTEQQRLIEDSEGHGGAAVLRPGTVLFRTMVTTLLYCCRFHRNKPETSTASPVALRRQFNIAEKQYFQMYLVALCIDEDWAALDALVTTRGFMGMGKKKKSPVGFERIVKTIARKSLKHPHEILKNYLSEIEDVELRLQLATEVGAYNMGLECLKLLRDRERLRAYINQIPVRNQPEFRRKIDSLLSNTHIKWK